MVGLGKRGNQLNRMIRNLVRATGRIFICTPTSTPKELNKDVGAAQTRLQGDHRRGRQDRQRLLHPPEEKFSTIGGLPYLYRDQPAAVYRRNQLSHIDNGRLNLMLWCCEKNSYPLGGSSWMSGPLLTGNNLNPRAWALDLENGLLVRDQRHHLREAVQCGAGEHPGTPAASVTSTR